MTGRHEPPTEPELDALAERIRRAAADRDPVPRSVLDHAVHALELRDVDAELAALVADSHAQAEQGDLALVRGPATARLLTFEVPGVVVELEVTGSGDRRALQGQVAGVAGADLTLEHPGGAVAVEPDEHGRFWVDTLPAGRLRLRLVSTGRRVTTAWVTV